MGVVFSFKLPGCHNMRTVHVKRVGECDGWVGAMVCCRIEGSFGVENSQLGRRGGVAIAGALRHVPLLTKLEYVVGEGASHEAVGCVG